MSAYIALFFVAVLFAHLVSYPFMMNTLDKALEGKIAWSEIDDIGSWICLPAIHIYLAWKFRNR